MLFFNLKVQYLNFARYNDIMMLSDFNIICFLIGNNLFGHFYLNISLFVFHIVYFSFFYFNTYQMFSLRF